MPSIHSGVISLGIFLMGTGVLMFLCLGNSWEAQGARLFGLALAVFGAILIVLGLYLAMKSQHVTTTGHFPLHLGACTRYHGSQAVIIQRRLDRIRRVVSEDREHVQAPPSHSHHSILGYPPLWDLDPPPSYETVMKSTMSTARL